MNRKLIFLISAIMLTTLILTGCPNLEEVTAKERMEMFIANVNTGNYDLKQHTHPSADQYSQAGETDFWSTRFSPYTPLTGLSVSGNTATATGFGDVNFTFTLEEDDPKVYKIRRIVRTGPTTIFE